ncbi:MAG: hypothetical protein IKZ61_00840 [Prevotella sp.]|nr:hypothetical protein [Prevotella sp.]
MKRLALIGIFLLSTITSCTAISYTQRETKAITLSQFGLNEAATGEQVYWVLYNAHTAAVAKRKWVDYSGVDTLMIDIPRNAKSIQLTSNNDFKGAVFVVTNKSKDIFLFEYENKSQPISISKADIDSGNFVGYKELRNGKHVLFVKDMSPWVENREGYKYGHIRKDILKVVNGKALNKVIMPYNNNSSSPECEYSSIADEGPIIRNLTIKRTMSCINKTFLCKVSGTDGVTIENVSIYTPENNWENDQIITINNSTNVSFKNLRIEGTYSRLDHSGYGVALNNIWNFTADKMYGHGNWGIFGTNNISGVTITNSDINRFDVHCYGREMRFKSVIFRNKYNQFSAVYGSINFDNCTFINCVPLVNGPSYNAYVGYDVSFNDCEYSTTHDTPILVDEGYLDEQINIRQELSERCLPNVRIKNLIMHIPKKAPNVYLFFFRERGDFKKKIGHISELHIENVKFKYEDDKHLANFVISNFPLNSTNSLNEVLLGVDVIGNSTLKSKEKGLIINNFEIDPTKSSSLKLIDVRAASVVKKKL